MTTIGLNNVGFILENCDEIWFDIADLKEFQLSVSPDHFLKLDNQQVVGFRAVEYAMMNIDAKANHTYNCFGQPSKITNFAQLLNGATVAGIAVASEEEGYETFYLAEDKIVSFELDLCGNLIAEVEDVSEPCCAECELDF